MEHFFATAGWEKVVFVIAAVILIAIFMLRLDTLLVGKKSPGDSSQPPTRHFNDDENGLSDPDGRASSKARRRRPPVGEA